MTINKALTSITIISSILILFSISGTAYADPHTIQRSGTVDSQITITWQDGDSNVLFYYIQVIQTNGELETLHKSFTNQPGDKTVTFEADNEATYDVQITSVKTNHSMVTAEKKDVKTGHTPPPLPDKATIHSVLLSGLTYSGNEFNAVLTGSSHATGGTITERVWTITDENGKIVRKQTGSTYQLYPGGDDRKSHKLDHYYTIEYRVFNGVWSDPYTVIIDWEPHKRDVIQQVKDKIEYTKENKKVQSQKIWQQVLLALDGNNIPEDSEYRYDPVKNWSNSGSDRKLTPFDTSMNAARAVGDKFVGKANIIVDESGNKAPNRIKVADNETYYLLKDVNPAKYQKLLDLAALWYNVHAYR